MYQEVKVSLFTFWWIRFSIDFNTNLAIDIARSTLKTKDPVYIFESYCIQIKFYLNLGSVVPWSTCSVHHCSFYYIRDVSTMSFGKTAAITIFINNKYNVTQLTVCPRITLYVECTKKQIGNYIWDFWKWHLQINFLIQQKLSQSNTLESKFLVFLWYDNNFHIRVSFFFNILMYSNVIFLPSLICLV